MTEKPISADRRCGQRTPVRVPVKVRHEGSEHEGLTRDLSSSGIFLYSEPGMKPGSKLELVIMLPPGLGFGSGGWTLCEASVVRLEKSDDKQIGIAATFDRVAWLPEIALTPRLEGRMEAVLKLIHAKNFPLRQKDCFPLPHAWCNNGPL